MIGLMYILAFVVYLAISAVVIVAVGRWAGRRGKSQWTWVIGTTLVMYLIVFWDLLPTLIAKEVLCARTPAVRVFMSANDWAAERSMPPPSTPIGGLKAKQPDDEYYYVQIAPALAIRTTSHPVLWLPISIHTEQLVDSDTRAILVERKSVGKRNRNPTDRLKPWFPSTTCGPQPDTFDALVKGFQLSAPARP